MNDLSLVPPADIDISAEVAELTRHPQADPRRYALALVDGIMRGSPMAMAEQTAVCLLAATMAISRMPAAQDHRGKVINAACEDFRRMLQKQLPL